MSESFVFYSSWLDIIEQNYPDDLDKQNQLIRNIVLYGIRGEKNEALERMFLQQTFAQIDSAKSKHDKRVEAGRKGGKKSKGGGAPNGNQNAKKKTTSKQQANDNDNGNVNDNIPLSLSKDNDNGYGVGTRLKAVPPPKYTLIGKPYQLIGMGDTWYQDIRDEEGRERIKRLDELSECSK